jgi:predicted nucleic acid-binding protein
MQALAVRSLQELRTRRVSMRPAPPNSSVPDPVREQQSAELIRDFQAAIQEFAGTGQEMSFVQDLLGIFKREGRYHEWVSLFLEHVYRDPIHDVIGRLANDALIVAKAAHREQEVLTALRHLHDIPFEFAAKPAVESALTGTAGGIFLAGSGAVVAADERRD